MKKAMMFLLMILLMPLSFPAAAEAVYVNIAGNGIVSQEIDENIYGDHGTVNLFDSNQSSYFQSVSGKNNISMTFDYVNTIHHVVITTDVDEDDYWKFNMVSVAFSGSTMDYDATDTLKSGYTSMVQLPGGLYQYTYALLDEGIECQTFGISIADHYGITSVNHISIYEIELYADESKIPQKVITDIAPGKTALLSRTDYSSNAPANMYDNNDGTYFSPLSGWNFNALQFGGAYTVTSVVIIANAPAADYELFNMNRVYLSNTVSASAASESDRVSVLRDDGVSLGDGKYQFTYDFSSVTGTYKCMGLETYNYFGSLTSGITNLKIYTIKVYAETIQTVSDEVQIENVATSGTVLTELDDSSYSGKIPANMFDGNDDTYCQPVAGWNMVALQFDKLYPVDHVEVTTNAAEADYQLFNMSKVYLSGTAAANAASLSDSVYASYSKVETLDNGHYRYTYDFSGDTTTYKCMALEIYHHFGNLSSGFENISVYEIEVYADVNQAVVEYTQEQKKAFCIAAFNAVTANTFQYVLQEWSSAGIILPDDYSLLSTSAAAHTFAVIMDEKFSGKFTKISEIEKCLEYTELIEAMCRSTGTELSNVIGLYFGEYFDVQKVYDALLEEGVTFSQIYEKARTQDYTIDDEEALVSLVNGLLITLAFGGDMQSAEAFDEKIENYIALLPDVKEDYQAYIGSYTTGLGVYYMQICSSVTADDLKQKMTRFVQKSLLMAYLNQGTAKEIASVIEQYGAFFGLSEVIAKAEKANISLTAIAKDLKLMSFDSSDELDLLSDRIGTIIGELTAAAGSSSSGTKKSTSGGGGSSAVTIDLPVPVPVQAVQTVSQTPFADMNGYEWALSAVGSLYSEGIIGGTGDGLFEPQRQVTREEFIKMMILALKLDSAPTSIVFMDSDKEDWYYPYINAAVASGLIKGVSDNLFGVGLTMTREDMAVIAARALKLAKSGNLSEYSDYTEISGYAQKSVSLMLGAGIMQGYEDKTIQPKNAVTRAEAAVFIEKVKKERNV